MDTANRSDWFSGNAPRTAAEAAFLRRLHTDVAGWRQSDLTPGDTTVMAVMTPFYVAVDVPRLPRHGRTTLEIAFWHTGLPVARLEGSWGDDHLLDSYDGNDRECLTVAGLDATPEDFAVIAADWLHRQLQRPVERHDWTQRDRIVATSWRLADTGRVITTEGSAITRRLLHLSERVQSVRP